MNVWKPLETALTVSARIAWPVFQAINRQVPSKSFQPKWAPAPLLKSHQRTKPQLGWPRTTDSLCPTCVREARARIVNGDQSIATLVEENVGQPVSAMYICGLFASALATSTLVCLKEVNVHVAASLAVVEANHARALDILDKKQTKKNSSATSVPRN